MDNCSQHKKAIPTQSPFSKAWEEYKITEKFKELKKAVNQSEPFNENILWWAFKEGFESAENQTT